MRSKLEFVEAGSRPGANVSALCREHEISRQTGHKWLKRYQQIGPAGLEERSRRPGASPSRTGSEVVSAVLGLRDRHPSWGPKKLAQVLARDLGADGPSSGTVARLLRSAGKILKRRPAVRVWHVDDRPHVEARLPNDLWTIDFKGWWRARNGERCEPLTVRDAASRMVLCVSVVGNTRGAVVKKALEKLFRKLGVPKAMLMDNGSPWISSRARAGLTALSAWLVSLGVRLFRSRPGSPQDNGGHERMHRDLNELRLSPGSSRRAQQRLTDRWVLDFNHIRPHEALGGKTPAEVYTAGKANRLEVKIPVYPAGTVTRRVLSSGEVTLNGDRVSVGRGLVGQLVGLRYESGLRWRVYFFDLDMGTIELAEHSLISTVSVRLPTTVSTTNEGPPLTTTVSP